MSELFNKWSNNDPEPLPAKFDGSDYVDSIDRQRLAGQILRVHDAMIDGRWRTVNEIHAITGDPHASISAQLRHLRKPKFGKYLVAKRSRGRREDGFYEYQVLNPKKGTLPCPQRNSPQPLNQKKELSPPQPDLSQE